MFVFLQFYHSFRENILPKWVGIKQISYSESESDGAKHGHSLESSVNETCFYVNKCNYTTVRIKYYLKTVVC